MISARLHAGPARQITAPLDLCPPSRSDVTDDRERRTGRCGDRCCGGSIGEAPNLALLARIYPVGWEHIAVFGDFLWDRAAETVCHKPVNIGSDRYPT